MFNFKTKAEYLKYRAAWKASYMLTSVEIRELKKQIKTHQRANMYAGNFQASKQYLRNRQRIALEELVKAKLEAGRQYNATQLAELAEVA